MDWDSVKGLLGYTETPSVQCHQCAFSKEDADYLAHYCCLHQQTLGLMPVKVSATCKFAQPKGK